ncbi:MAG: nuclear transport factor 2 family protein [Sphingobacteriales bacterium]|nr:MAG: nuclear transport factor 2 family protein [Sphingobacteriales bacterium]
MFQIIYAIAIVVFTFLSCNDKSINIKTSGQPQQLSRATNIKVAALSPTVKIESYTLVSSGQVDRLKDAAAIIDLKQKWPMVMQSPNRLGFDTILSKDFTFTGDGLVLNRAGYINNRLSPSDWKITFVQYDNISLQFFDSIGLLSYKNQVTNHNVKTNEVEKEHISWADIYVKENGKWKIGASHTVDVQIEKLDKDPKLFY